jgi:hypothetical protein
MLDDFDGMLKSSPRAHHNIPYYVGLETSLDICATNHFKWRTVFAFQPPVLPHCEWVVFVPHYGDCNYDCYTHNIHSWPTNSIRDDVYVYYDTICRHLWCHYDNIITCYSITNPATRPPTIAPNASG